MVYLDLDGCLHHSPHTFPHFTSLFDLGLGTFQCVYLLRVSSDCRELDHRLLWQIPALFRGITARERRGKFILSRRIQAPAHTLTAPSGLLDRNGVVGDFVYLSPKFCPTSLGL